jgi:N-acetyl sugar amidotransferase
MNHSKTVSYFDKMKHCTKCLLPETHECVTFDEQGVCSVCKNHAYKQEVVDWNKREEEFYKLLSTYRNSGQYDCIIPGSGGKDSTFQVYILTQKYRLKPLVVTFDHGLFRPTVKHGWERTLRRMGVDHISFRPSWQVIKKVMLESLKRKGDFCWHCHSGIYAYPMHIAVKFNIPLIIWGEPTSEYTSYCTYDGGNNGREVLDEKAFNKYRNLGITAHDMYEMLNGEVELRDLECFCYPMYKDLQAIRCQSICLGDYIPWDTPKQVALIKKELGWREDRMEGVPPDFGYEKIECMLEGVRDYLKYIKRGYGRTNHLMNLEIRNGRISRDEAIEKVEKHDGRKPASLVPFLKWLGLTEDEFMEIARSHCISPHQHDNERVRIGYPLWDQHHWDRMVSEE